MCCPGCFSMYKLNAVREIVDEYSRPVEKMEDIFTKDNGKKKCLLFLVHICIIQYFRILHVLPLYIFP